MFHPKRTLSEATKKIIAFNQGYKCFLCSNLLPPTYQVDHNIPFSINQDDTEKNLRALCPNCHAVKTQREFSRISNFKKLQKDKGKNLCWFCLEEISKEHKCLEKLKEIVINVDKSKPKTEFDTVCNQFAYKTDLKDTQKDRVLRIEICLYNLCIYVNNMIYKSSDNDIRGIDIVNAVDLSTRSKKYTSFFNSIELIIIHNWKPYPELEKQIEECYEYIIENIVDLFPERIFSSDGEITLITC